MILSHTSALGHALPVLTAAVAVLVGAVLLLRTRRKPEHRFRTLLLWSAGWVVIVAATLPAVEVAAQRSLAAHMIQHLVFWVIAPPLIVAAHPLRELARAGLVRPNPRWAGPVERHAPSVALASWLAIVITLYGSHLTPLYDQALGQAWLHDAEHVAYLAASLGFWSLVLGRRRSGAGLRALLAAATTAPVVFLGMILTTTDKVLYTTYLNRLGPEAALTDQQTGGAIMWLGSLAAIVPLLLWLPWRWATNEQKRQEILENW